MEKQGGGRGRLGLRAKFIGLIGLLLILSGASLGFYFIHHMKKAFEEELSLRGNALAKNLARNSTYGVSIEDAGILDRFAEVTSEEADVAYVRILDRKGRILSSRGAGGLEKLLEEAITKKAMEMQAPLVQAVTLNRGQKGYDIAFPVISRSLFGQTDSGDGDEHIGLVRVGISLQEMDKKLESLLKTGGLITVLVIGLGIGLSVFFVRMIVQPIEGMAAAAVKMAEGDFTQEIQAPSGDEIGVLGGTFGKMTGNLSAMIGDIQEVAEQVARAAQQMNSGGKRIVEGSQRQADSIDAAGSSLEEMNASIKQIAQNTEVLSSSAEESSSSILEMGASIGEVAQNAAGLALAVEDTSSSIMQMSASIKQVAENIQILSSASEETSSAIEEINTTVREVETHAKDSAQLSERVSRDARELGMKSIEKTISGMNRIQETVVKSVEVINRLGERSEQIGNILTVIDEVTKQTSLLALNAAILAAQAGEQGKGFAVVADEIKNLADRTGASTKEIGQLISNVQAEAKDAVDSIRAGAKSVEEGVSLSLEAGEALKKILESATQSTTMAHEIERAAVEQSRGIRQVTESVQRTGTMVQQILKAIQEQSRGSEQIMRSSEKMRDMTRQVKMSTEEQAKGSRQITTAVENVTERVQEIARAINEQRRGSDIIIRSVEEVRQFSKESLSLVAEMNQTAKNLAVQAQHLKESVGQFKIKRGAA